MKRKALFIVGPTASGKTDLAFMLAPKFNGVLINADSRQVYRGLDIIAGKDIPKNSEFIKSEKPGFGYFLAGDTPIFLLDLIESNFSFNVADYFKIAIPIIEKISIDKLPIIVGGSGFYLKALIDGIESLNVPPNEKLRKELGDLSIDALFDILKKENPRKAESMNQSDKRNRRRLIRAIEISRSIRKNKEILKLKNYDILTIGLKAERDEIKNRIDKRIKKRLDQGAIAEAEKLFKNYENLSEQVKTSNGYRQLFEYLKGKIDFQTAIDDWRKAEYLSAKKQMTFFRKDKRIIWFDIKEKNFLPKIVELIRQWYN